MLFTTESAVRASAAEGAVGQRSADRGGGGAVCDR